MSTWKPITEAEFTNLLSEQYAELDLAERKAFDSSAIPPKLVTITRFNAKFTETVNEQVYAVWEKDGWVLYFDDIEYGFNGSAISADDVLLDPRGNQFTLREAVQYYFCRRTSCGH
jgi:hypothetical protein